MANLLRNPGFEGGFRNWNANPEISVAEDWYPFWVAHQATDEDWKNRTPIYRAAVRAEDPRRVRAGQAGQMYYTNWATHVAGIMQTVAVTPGQNLQLTAFGHAWSTDSDVPDQSIQPGTVRMKVGIDPTGGTNPLAPSIIWSAERAVYDSYDAGFTVEAVAAAGQVAVFLFSAPEWPKKHNNVYWDDVQLETTSSPSRSGALSDVLLTVETPTQQAQMPVSIAATTSYALTNVQVIVSGPSGSLQTEYQGVQQEGPVYVWRWQFTPPVEGPYTVTLSADGLQAISSNVRIISPTPVLAQPSPVSTSTSGRGLPRTQYHRTYVLLPPTTGKEWVQAIIETEAWSQKRWTIGFSADDAGVGDLDKRTVIVVNPSAWPDPILPWLQMWYPGVEMRAVTAVSPADLRAILDGLAASEPKPELG